MDKDVFGEEPVLPSIIEDLVGTNYLKELSPGAALWIPGYAVGRDEAGDVAIITSHRGFYHNETPGGLCGLKAIRDFDGWYLDMTALTREEVERILGQLRVSASESDRDEDIPVNGILYPRIVEMAGVDPEAAAKFNQDQAAVRKRFAAYYRRRYGHDYVFAEEEYAEEETRRRERNRRHQSVGSKILRWFGLLR
jgi:hypothetical protein